MKRFLNCLLIALVLAAGFPTTAAALRLPWHRKKARPEVEVMAAQGKTIPAPRIKPERKVSAASDGDHVISKPGPIPFGPPIEISMMRAASSRIDLRALPQTPQSLMERPEREAPAINRGTIRGSVVPPEQSRQSLPTQNAPAPPPVMNFDGLDFATWGAGHPPDTNGDVGPNYYIQTVNTSIGIFRKSDGVRVAAFSFNTFMSQGHFGNLCDTNNFGDPVVLYDSFEDRWIITDFAFKLSGNNVINPPGNFQCFAASMSGDPVSGGWNFYSINTAGGLGDYPKFGVWPDGLYMSVNMFDYAASGAFQNPRVYALNKAQMYAGMPSIQVLTFNAPAADFTILPSNARLQTGTPPPGSPNYFVSTEEFLDALTVYKFHVDWTRPTASTFTGPDTPFASTSWPNDGVPDAPSQGGSALDVIEIRAMVQNQYTNLGGAESLWVPHTVRRPGIDGSGNPNGFAAPRWYQVDVTGGTVNDNLPQAATWDPDGANVINRFVPSVAVDRAGDMALGYSTSSSTTKPALKYAGRLATDPINTFSQSEQLLFQGAGTQTSTDRWGDYSSMTLDPNGCTFWYTNEYYAANGSNWQTRIGSFAFPSCTVVGPGGTISGTVTAAAGGAPITGATVTLGSRTATTNGSGVYSFPSLPAGTYSSIAVTDPGYDTASANSIAVTDGNATTRNFALTAAPASGCPSDTTQADFQTGVPANVDVVSSPGDVILLNTATVDQQNATIGDGNGNISGVVITSTAFGGQTFTPAITGVLRTVDLNLFCFGCTGTTPNLTLSVRATSGGLPTGADLASATIPGFSNGVAAYYTTTFASPATLTAGTKYALIVRPVTDPSAGGVYALSRSGDSSTGADVYAAGTRVSDSANGTSWSIPLTGGVSTDAGFKTYMQTGFVASGTLISSARDSNPSPGITTTWSALSWNASIPATTTLRFQAAGSNAAGGPFSFIGPDGTAATFFTTSGASLAQFNGFRYLQYKAYLSTTDTSQTPVLNDVTVCFSGCSASTTITPAPAQLCANVAGNTASGPAGETSYSWSITNGSIAGSATLQSVTYTSGVSGNVGLTLNVVEPGGCHKSASINVPVFAAPSITPDGPTTFCAGGSVTLTSSASNGNQWLLNGNPIGGATNQTYAAAATGSYSVTGNGCAGSPSTPVSVTANPVPTTPSITISNVQTITQSGPSGTFALNFNGQATSPLAFNASAAVVQSQLNALSNIGAAGGSVTVGLAGNVYTITFGGTLTGPQPQITAEVAGGAVVTVNANPVCAASVGNQASGPAGATTYAWSITNGTISSATTIQTITYTVGASGTVVLNLIVTNAAGCGAASVPGSIPVNPVPATPVITPGGPTTFCAGGSVTLTSSSATDNQWSLNGNPIGGAASQSYIASATGNYTVTVSGGNGCTSTSAVTMVTVNPIPPAPAISGATSFCTGGSTTLTSSSALGNQWSLGGNPIGGATNQTLVASAAGNYTVTVTTSGCTSAPSAITTVTVNPIPATPTVSAGGSTTFCAGGSVTLTSSAASGNQWFLTGNPIGGATSKTYIATAAGNYTVTATTSGCTSAASTATVITVNPIPPTPTITPGGPTTFCAGGSVTLTSSSASGNQWSLNGNPIGGATNTTFVAPAAGSYTVRVTASGCTSAMSAAKNVTVNPNPNATITVLSTMPSTTSTTASVVDAGVGATYLWTISGGTITGGTGTRTITFIAGPAGTLNLTAKVTTAAGCIDTKPANVTVTVPPVTVTSILPVNGSAAGGTSVTINGTGFVTGAQVTIGGTAATNVVLVSATQITAKTPAHAAATANVTVTNTDTSTGTLTNGYVFLAHQFDPNGDSLIDIADIFYLINHFFFSGPPAHGAAGALSGDANGDGSADLADIFYLINYIFMHGPAPLSAPVPGRITTTAFGSNAAISGEVTLGTAVLRDGRYVVPVMVTTAPGSDAAQALSLSVHFSGTDRPLTNASIHRAGTAANVQPVFETSKQSGDGLSYLVSYDGFDLGRDGHPAVVAEIDLGTRNASGLIVSVEPGLTMLSNQAGIRSATVGNGLLRVSGTTINRASPVKSRPRNELN